MNTQAQSMCIRSSKSKSAWIATLAVAAAAASTGTAAQVPHYRDGNYAVPSPYVQQVPMRVWVPGHWEWNGYQNIWMPGYYEVHSAVVAPHGRARRDLDRHGISDRYDRDRDGDGVPNRYDRHPNNPWRR